MGERCCAAAACPFTFTALAKVQFLIFVLFWGEGEDVGRSAPRVFTRLTRFDRSQSVFKKCRTPASQPAVELLPPFRFVFVRCSSGYALIEIT